MRADYFRTKKAATRFYREGTAARLKEVDAENYGDRSAVCD
jgi:hypothetical protein